MKTKNHIGFGKVGSWGRYGRIVWAAGVLATNTFAATDLPIDPGQVPTYVQAVMDGGFGSLTCDPKDAAPVDPYDPSRVHTIDLLETGLRAAASGFVNSTRVQPVLTLVANVDLIGSESGALHTKSSADHRWRFVVTTSADFKKVVQVLGYYEKSQARNDGTILHPDYRSYWVADGGPYKCVSDDSAASDGPSL